jgi:hypothetical protein
MDRKLEASIFLFNFFKADVLLAVFAQTVRICAAEFFF